MFLIYFISYGCNGGALVFLGGAEASASPSFALPMFITIKKKIILHLFLGVPAATVGGTGTPWHTRGYAPDIYIYISGGPLSALTCCVNARLLSGDKKNIAVNLFSKLIWELGLYYASYDDFHPDILARMYT